MQDQQIQNNNVQEQLNQQIIEVPQQEEQPQINIKPYQSQYALQTQKQILNSKISLNRPLLKMQILKKRRDFGQPYKLNQSDADKNIQFKAVTDPLIHKKKKIIEIGLQGTHPYTSTGVQTKWSRRINKALQIQPQANTYQVQDDNTEFLRFLENTYPLMQQALQSNETIDIFQNDFNVLDNNDGQVENTQISNAIKQTKSLFYLNCKGKRVCCIEFLPWIGKQNFHIVAQSFLENLTFDQRVTFSMKSSKSSILFWNFQDLHQIDPILILNSPLEILSFKINQTDPNIIVGGAINGQIFLWDLKGFNFGSKSKVKKQRYKKSHRIFQLLEQIKQINYSICSALQDPGNIITTVEGIKKNVASHKNPVLCVRWIPKSIQIDRKFLYNTFPNSSPLCNQFVSISNDGQILFWDKRFFDSQKKQIKNYQGISWKALFGMQLFRPQGGAMMGGSFLKFKKKQKKGRMTVSSDQGQLLIIDWTNKPTQQNPKPDPIITYWSNQKSMRPPTALQLSPFYDDIIMTVHDYHFTVWKQKIEVPIFQSMLIKNTYITCGKWSISRPGVIIIAKSDGILDIWDFLDQSHKCTLQYQVTAIGLTSLKFHFILHNILAVGDNQGNLHILQLPFSFCKKIGDQQKTMLQFWDRQVQKVKYFENRFQIRQNQVNKQKTRKQLQQNIQNQKQIKQKEVIIFQQKQIAEDDFQKLYKQFIDQFLLENVNVPNYKQKSF